MKKGFTLVEILIALVIIGVVAALTLSPIITNIKNKGAIEKLKKAQATLQVVTMELTNEGVTLAPSYKIAQEQGDDALWEAFQSVVDLYVSKMNVAKNCGYTGAESKSTFCNINIYQYKFLNNNSYDFHYLPFMGSYSILL